MTPIHVDKPIAGLYWTRLVRGGPKVPVKIWHGQPPDPVTGELLDRSLRWQALRNGVEVNVEFVWPYCADHPIDQREYDYLLSLNRHCVEHEPEAPEAAPGSPVDFATMRPLF